MLGTKGRQHTHHVDHHSIWRIGNLEEYHLIQQIIRLEFRIHMVQALVDSNAEYFDREQFHYLAYLQVRMFRDACQKSGRAVSSQVVYYL